MEEGKKRDLKLAKMLAFQNYPLMEKSESCLLHVNAVLPLLQLSWRATIQRHHQYMKAPILTLEFSSSRVIVIEQCDVNYFITSNIIVIWKL